MALTVGRQEYPHHTREQIVGYLRDAAAIVAEAEIDRHLREPAFLKVIDFLAAKQIVFEQQTLGIRGPAILPTH